MSKKDLDGVSTEELLAGLAVPARPSASPVVQWLESVGYFPGTTAVSATEMWNRYREWEKAQPAGTIANPQNFGQVARERTQRVPKKRRKWGICYYMATQADPEVPAELTWRKDGE